MKQDILLLAVAGVLLLAGCSSTVIRDIANSQCERRVHSDRARCLRNVRSSDAAMAARYAEERRAGETWEAQTLERIEAIPHK